jgi:transketolase
VEEVALTKEKLGWPANAQFLIPERALPVFRQAVEQGQQAEAQWRELFEQYQAAHPEDAALLEKLWAGELPAGWTDALPGFTLSDGPLATRKASGAVLNAIAPALPTLIGGSADLAPSTNTLLKGFPDFQRETPAGRNFHFGVREHAMGSILSGLALHGGVIPYGATFLVFSDYMRPPVRLAAMMGLPVIYVWTHDSVWIGEDGPTHQPVEHLAALRAIPNLVLIRPADANETAAAWRVALERRDGPTALILTRQKVPVTFETMHKPFDKVSRGAYILTESSGVSNALIIASGSEVHVALEARELLAQQGVGVRIVSMPSQELFDAQPPEYQDSVLPPLVTARLAIEAGVTYGWKKYVGSKGDVLGLDRFGASAPYQVLMEKFGFTAEAVAERVLQLLK